jgi:hypothetical protein
MGLDPGLAQSRDASQPSGKRASVVSIGLPKIEVGTKHFASEMGLSPRFTQNDGISQPSGKRASVVGIGIPGVIVSLALNTFVAG